MNQEDWQEEDKFRENVRFVLGMDSFTRDDQIIAEIERLKRAVRFMQPVEAIKIDEKHL